MKSFRNIILLLIIATSVIFMASCSESATNPSGRGYNTNSIVYSTPWEGDSAKPYRDTTDTYIIIEGKHLAWLTDQTTNITANIKFNANIDMNNKSFGGINKFAGVMDGNSKRIKNLNIIDTNTDGGVGLIYNLLENGQVKNLTIESGTIKGKGENTDAGSFVGVSGDNTIIQNVTNKASVELIKSSTVESTSSGILGRTIGLVTIKNAVNYGDINADTASGIVGFVSTKIVIDNVKNLGNISGGSMASGIIALADGSANVEINRAENYGDISAFYNAGGIVGYIECTAKINNVGNSGKLTTTSSNSHAGGIIGTAQCPTLEINNAYNYISNIKIIANNYNTATTITSNYSLNYTPPIEAGVTILTVNSFKDKSNFDDWDFVNIWEMGDKHPVLR